MVAPRSTTVTCGAKAILRWSITTCSEGGSNFFPAMASTYTTIFSADLIPWTLTFPLIPPAQLRAGTSNATTRLTARIAPCMTLFIFDLSLARICRPISAGAFLKNLENIVNPADDAVGPEELCPQRPGQRFLPAVFIFKRDFNVGADQKLETGAEAVPRVIPGRHCLSHKIRG